MAKTAKQISTFVFILLPALLLIPIESVNAQAVYQGRFYVFGQLPSEGKTRQVVGVGGHYTPANDWSRLELRYTRFKEVKPWFEYALGQRSNFAFKNKDLISYELRPFQAAYLYLPEYSSVKVTHRFMLEERMFFNSNYSNQFTTRFRYRLELKVNLSSENNIYMRPMSEAFFAINDHEGRAVSQWKNTLAVGGDLSESVKMEFRYEYALSSHDNSKYLDAELNGLRLQVVYRF